MTSSEESQFNTYHGLVKLLLSHEFYLSHSHRCDDIIPKSLSSVYSALDYAHRQYARDISIDELVAVHEKLNPSITRRNREDLYKVFKEIGETNVSPDIGSDIIANLWKIKIAEKVASRALDIAEGELEDWSELEALVQKAKEGTFEDAPEDSFVTMDLTTLLEELQTDNKWKFNLPGLAEIVGTFGAGHLMILAARTDVGKTAAWVSFAFAEGGWADQGAKVHVICNEEPANRTMLRGVCARTAMTKEEVLARLPYAQETMNRLRENIFLSDCVGMSLGELEAYAKKHSPDILVVDQADKITVSGNYSNETLKIKAIYTGLREIAKRYGCAVLCITQLSNDGANKLYVSIDAMENSKTAKQAEADLIICMGMEDITVTKGEDDGTRMLNVGKNKLSGLKRAVPVKLDRFTSRFIA